MTGKRKEGILRGTAVCIVLSALILGVLSLVITPKAPTDKGGTLYYQGSGFLSEPENSLEVLTFGNSDAYAGIDPLQLETEYGISSYTSAAPMQTMGGINRLLGEALRKHTPEVIVLETDCFYETASPLSGKLTKLTALFQFHARWKDLKARDFYTVPQRGTQKDPDRGYIPCDTVCAFRESDYMGSPDSAPEAVSKATLREIAHFMKTCKEHNIQVVFTELPSPSSWSYAKHNYVASLAEEYGVPFLDMNLSQTYGTFNSRTDYRDQGNHLNSFGAKKATAFLGNYLSTQYASAFAPNDSSNFASLST